MTEAELEWHPVVANCRMNRGRRLHGRGGYSRELGFDPLERVGSGGWLDVGCGEGHALREAARVLPGRTLVGLDLVGPSEQTPGVTWVIGPVRSFEPEARFDLITAVHVLHYVADKLGTLERLRSWLAPGGTLVAQLDLAQVWVGAGPAPRTVSGWLRTRGYGWDARAHRVMATGVSAGGAGLGPAPWRFVEGTPGGPNYTGQEGVVSRYERG